MNVLAIESAVGEGSIAILRDGSPIAVHEGEGASRAERILPIIAALLQRSKLSNADIDLIAVSAGPGSYSGIRIGMATALGLRDSLGVRSVAISVLEAMSDAAPTDRPLQCAVPVGKNDIAWQSFGSKASGTRVAVSEPSLSSVATFTSHLAVVEPSDLFAHTEALDRIKGSISERVVCVDAGTTLANYLGQFAAGGTTAAGSMRAIYLRNQDATRRSF
jgi:tRNA threonylcarbamoyladenosine biosynthesis protein TsaB